MISAILLIPACSIGAGLLSFPVITGLSGFLPSTLVILLGWIFALISGLTMLELCYTAKTTLNKDELHFFSISHAFLPKILKFLALSLFLAINYASLAGYCAAIPNIYTSFITSTLNNKIIGMIAITILFLGAQLSTKTLCKINNILTPGMFITYLTLLYYGFTSYDFNNLTHVNFKLIHTSIPVIVTAFSYQFIIPTIANMLSINKKLAKICLIIGTSFNAIIYLIWNFTMLGCVPLSQLLIAYHSAMPITSVLTGNTLTLTGNLFAVFSIITSFLSITICMLGYWKDYLNLSRSFIPSIFVFLPVLAVYFMCDKIFLWIFSITGGYGDSLLFGLIPVYIMYTIKQFNWQTTLLLAISTLILSTQIFLDYSGFFRL